jgi:hypothetical protein
VSPYIISAAGAVLNAVGVIALFYWGIPLRNRGGGNIYMINARRDEKELELERQYDRIGKFALALIVIGCLMQACGSWASVPK